MDATALATLSTEKLGEFLATLVPEGSEVYLPAEAVRRHLESLAPEEAWAHFEALGIVEQLPDVLTSGADVVIPLPKYLAAVGDAHRAWRDDIRLELGGRPTAQEASKGTGKIGALFPGWERSSGIVPARDVRNDIGGQSGIQLAQSDSNTYRPVPLPKSAFPKPIREGGPSYWSVSREVNGVRVYQRTDLINPARMDPAGVTSLERMRRGLPPIGPDGKPLHLHHLIQTKGGPLAEITATFHQTHTRIVHINPNSIGSGIDKVEFARFRYHYWRNRAADFQ